MRAASHIYNLGGIFYIMASVHNSSTIPIELLIQTWIHAHRTLPWSVLVGFVPSDLLDGPIFGCVLAGGIHANSPCNSPMDRHVD